MINNFFGTQKEILTSQNNNILVSAGAGSGKTTIMIEKIANLIIEENVPVNNLLVVTFTVLAAQEMKDRLVEKLNEILLSGEDKEKFLNIIEQVKTASIDTIDGFSAKTIKKYFYTLQISPNIEIISDATKDYYLNLTLKKTIEEYNPEQLLLLLDIFGGDGRNLFNLQDLMLKTYYNIINLEDYNLFLQKAINQYKPNSECEQIVKNYILNKVNFSKKIIIEEFNNIDINFQLVAKNWVATLENFNSNQTLEEILTKLNILSLPDLKGKRNCEALKTSVNNIKLLINKFKEEGFFTNNQQKNDEILKYLTNFLSILTNFMQNYTEIKQKNNLIDFNDLNRLMLKLMQNKQVLSELQQQFKYIFIDEYQDVNPLQDALINNLLTTNTKLFLVGDVKQSIYGFRGANPNSFLNRLLNYNKNNQLGKAYNMNDNYRSNPKILNFVNDVFCRIMTETEADINYLQDCVIQPKRTDIEDEKVQILLAKEEKKPLAQGLYSVKDSIEQEQTNGEAILVLLSITKLIGTPFYDAKQKTIRPLEYKDIAILSRSVEDKEAKNLITFLQQNNVPLNLTSKLDINKNEGVKLILSILKCVIGNADDVDYLASCLALTSITLQEIAEIKLENNSFYSALFNSNNKNAILFKQIIKNIYTTSLHSSNSQLIFSLLNEFGLRYNLLLKSNGKQTVKEIEEFCFAISGLENQLNIAEFVKVMESSINKANEVESLDDENSVTVLTIHKSKGLEYPVVILFNTNKQFNYITDNALINFNAQLGLGVEYYNYETRTKTNSIPRFANKLKNDVKAYKEEMRLLYVALTRAKNKLIITGQYKENSFLQAKSTNFLNMLVGGFLPLKEGENEFENCNIYLLDEVKPLTQNIEVETKVVEFENKNFVYLNQQKFNLPLKNTVTGLNTKKSETLGFATKAWLTKNEQSNIDEDKAIIGTHYHKALESLNFNLPYLKNTNFEDVDYKKIENAHKTIYPLAKNAKQHKEAEFMMYVPYNQLVESTVEDKVLVQGVVDLILEYENSITIIDYKFSGLPISELKQKYNQQLNLYKLAVEQAFKKPVEHMYIYSINTSELG